MIMHSEMPLIDLLLSVLMAIVFVRRTHLAADGLPQEEPVR
jgi:hypothetical protein